MIYPFRDSKFYYEEVGEGNPFLMIHGFSCDCHLMKGCMEPIFKEYTNYKRIYLDLPGMGKSDAPDWINNSDDMLEFLISFINKVIPDDSFLLAGQSYGGYLARGILLEFKERIDGLCLICPVAIADSNLRTVPNPYILRKDEELLSDLNNKNPEEAKNFSDNFVIQNPYTYQRFHSEIQVGLSAANNSFLDRLKQNYAFSFDVDDKKQALFIKPTLFLTGHQDDCVGYHDLWKIIDNYPRATFATLDGAGHNLHIEQQELFEQLVKDWILRIECEDQQND